MRFWQKKKSLLATCGKRLAAAAIKVTASIALGSVTSRSMVPVGRSYVEGKQRSNRCRPLWGDALACMHRGSGWDVPPHLCYRVAVCYRVYMCTRMYLPVHTHTHTHPHTYSRVLRCMQDDRKFRPRSPGLHLRQRSDDLSGNISPFHDTSVIVDRVPTYGNSYDIGRGTMGNCGTEFYLEYLALHPHSFFKPTDYFSFRGNLHDFYF